MFVHDVLKAKGRRVISIGPEASVKQALARFVEHNIGSLPVVEASGQVVGIFSERDVVFGDHRDFERFHRIVEPRIAPCDGARWFRRFRRIVEPGLPPCDRAR